MILRTFFKCLTCEEINAFRVQIGRSNLQKHEVGCTQCFERMQFQLHLNQDTVCINGFEVLNNCELLDYNDIDECENIPVHYLSNEIPALDSEINNDRAFPAIRLMQALSDNHKLVPTSLNTVLRSSSHLDIYEQWKIIEKAWSLSNNGKYSLAKKQLNTLSFRDELLELDIESAIHEFIRNYLAYSKVNSSLLEQTVSYIQKIPINRMRAFSEYFTKTKKEHMRRSLDVFKQFFNNFSEYSQVIFSEYLPDELIVTSNSFEKTKMFYGNCFEHFTSNIETLCCLNNLINGRNFDKFKNIDLKKFNQLSKANRTNPLNDNAIFSKVCGNLNSKLRNASHHGHIYYDDDVVKYKPNNNKEYTEITYTEYLKECTSLFNSFCILLSIEIYLTKIVFVYLDKNKPPHDVLNPLSRSIKIASFK